MNRTPSLLSAPRQPTSSARALVALVLSTVATPACSSFDPDQPQCLSFDANNVGSSVVRVDIIADGPNVETQVKATAMRLVNGAYVDSSGQAPVSITTTNTNGEAAHYLEFVAGSTANAVRIEGCTLAQGRRYQHACEGAILVRLR